MKLHWHSLWRIRATEQHGWKYYIVPTQKYAEEAVAVLAMFEWENCGMIYDTFEWERVGDVSQEVEEKP